MKELDPDKREYYHPIELSSIEKESLFEITYLANKAALKIYPEIPILKYDQIKVVPSIQIEQYYYHEQVLHPFFQGIAKDYKFYSDHSDISSWFNTRHKSLFLQYESIHQGLKNDKNTTLFNMGMDASNAVILAGRKPVHLEGEAAIRKGLNSFQSFFDDNLQGIVSDADWQEAKSYLLDNKSYLEVNGLENAPIVEGKLFIPYNNTCENLLVQNYLSRPVRAEFVKLFSHSLNLSRSVQDDALIKAQQMQDNTRILESVVIQYISRKGYETPEELLYAYQSGELGTRAIEESWL
jgi:hypothetical protein